MDRLTAFLVGSLFSVGLIISGMTNPSKVIGFLDVTGAWDPSLAFVMGGALAVYLPAYRYLTRRSRPVYAAAFDLPKDKSIHWQLLIGSAVFGFGWGLTGFCPAAAIAVLPALSPNAIAVTIGMGVGILGMRAARKAFAPSSRMTVADF